MNTVTAKRRPTRRAPQPPGDPHERLRAAIRAAAETEPDERLKTWLLKLVKGDADEGRQET